MPAATVATRYALCWPVGQNLCNNRPLIWGGLPPSAPRSAARPCPTRPCLPSTRRWLSSSFTRQSPCCCLNFWAFSVKMYVAKAVLDSPPPKRGRQNRRCHNGCQTMAGGTLAQDMTCPCARALLPVFLVIFSGMAGTAIFCQFARILQFFCVRHVFGINFLPLFLTMTAGSSLLSRIYAPGAAHFSCEAHMGNTISGSNAISNLSGSDMTFDTTLAKLKKIELIRSTG